MIVYLPEGIIRIDNIIEAKKLFSALEKFIEFEGGKELLNLVDQEINSKPHIPTMKFLSPKKEEINVFIES